MSQSSLREAIEKFNHKEFFDCHDILEDTWFEVPQKDKDFYQGLLHFAVAFHHLIDKKNPAGAKLQLKKCIERLKNYNSNYKGINIKLILKESQEALKKIDTSNIKDIEAPLIKFH